MKKFFLIIFFNLLFFSLAFCGLDYYLKHKTYGWAEAPEHSALFVSDDVDISDCDIESLPATFSYLESDWNLLPAGLTPSLYVGDRGLFGDSYIGKSKPLVIIGGSYAYGHGIEPEKTFPALLSEYTHRPVLNFAVSGGSGFTSVEKIYSEIAQDENLKQLVNSAEYVIYVHMSDHINRYLFVNGAKEYNLKFIPSRVEKFLTKLYTVRYIVGTLRLKYYSLGFPDIKMSEKFLMKMLINLNKHVKTFSPNSKFIIILYDEKIALEAYQNNKNAVRFVSDIMKSSVWNRFSNETGACIVHTKDITGFPFDYRYKLSYDFPLAGWHPNAEVWKMFTPLFVDKYLKNNEQHK